MWCLADSVFHSFSTVESTVNEQWNSTFHSLLIGSGSGKFHRLERLLWIWLTNCLLSGLKKQSNSDTRRGAKRTSSRWSDKTFCYQGTRR